MKLKSKLALTGTSTMAALFLGLNANAARMDMVDKEFPASTEA